MKLSYNRIAFAGIRAHKRAYFALCVGLFLSVFLVSALCFALQGLFLATQERQYAAYGRQDIYALNSATSDEEFLKTGFYEEIGHVYVSAVQEELSAAFGYYDAVAQRLLSRSFVSGRMPQKAGEIALEQGALEKLRLPEAALGAPITLSLTPIDGQREERTFTLVGILTEQSTFLNPNWEEDERKYFPALIVSPAEEPFATGALVRHSLMTLKEGVTRYAVLNHYWEDGEQQDIYSVSPSGYVSDYPEEFLTADTETLAYGLCAALLVGSLLCATAVGIAGAMESQLARKKEEIGMLRAVGATQKQIRRIFGRETWLLAAMVSPAAIAVGLIPVWVLSRCLPKYCVFAPSLWLLLPILLLSVGVILLSGGLPLRRAAKTVPMGVLRDTDMLRSLKNIRSHTRFSPAALIAQRKLRVNPSAVITPTVLMFLLFLLVSMALNMGVMLKDRLEFFATDRPTFELWSGGRYRSGMFHEGRREQELTREDIAQLRSLSGITRVELYGEYTVFEELGQTVPGYWTPLYYPYINPHTGVEGKMQLGHGHAQLLPPGERPEAMNMTAAEYAALQAVLGTQNHLSGEITLTVLTSLEMARFRAVAGEIDVAAINAGREVLLYAPDKHYYLREEKNGIHCMEEPEPLETLPKGYEYLGCIPNDYYTVGKELKLHSLMDVNTEDDADHDGSYEEYLRDYSAMAHKSCTVTVGALVDHGYFNHGGMQIITTEQGMQAMGFPYRLSTIDLYTGTLTPAQESALAERIESISLRGEDYTFTNLLQSNREYVREQLLSIALLAAVAIIFLSVCIAQISGSVSRRIRAEVRMLGTLRAVGADENTLARCYSLQIVACILAGTVLGMGVYWLGINNIPYLLKFPSTGHALLAAGLQLCFALAALLACLGILRVRIKEIIRKPIVENIREL